MFWTVKRHEGKIWGQIITRDPRTYDVTGSWTVANQAVISQTLISLSNTLQIGVSFLETLLFCCFVSSCNSFNVLWLCVSDKFYIQCSPAYYEYCEMQIYVCMYVHIYLYFMSQKIPFKHKNNHSAPTSN